MKKILKLTLASILASSYIYAKEKDIENYIDFSIGAWNVSWDQTSKASNKFDNNALLVNYNIDDSVALTSKLKMNYSFLSGKAEYYSTKASASDKESIESISLSAFLFDLIPYINIETKYIATDFNGKINALKVSNNVTSSGLFETELKIWDFIVYPANETFGIGYRKYNYDLPQDMYIVRNSNNTLIANGLANIEYDGHFIEFVIDNSKQVDKKRKFSGLEYNLTAGIGKLEAKAKGYEQYLTDADAIFYDLAVAYTSKKLMSKRLNYGWSVGYRYNKIETEAKTSGEYSMVTEFESEFHGPFVNLSLKY